MEISASARERIFSQLIIDQESGCLLWTGRKNRDGYGTVKVNQRFPYVHRLMYELFVGEIPDGLQLDHVRAWGCRNRHCASPAHLEPVTSEENAWRSNGLAHGGTHCGAGHEYDLINTRWDKRGHRVCRACEREAERRRPPRKRQRSRKKPA